MTEDVYCTRKVLSTTFDVFLSCVQRLVWGSFRLFVAISTLSDVNNIFSPFAAYTMISSDHHNSVCTVIHIDTIIKVGSENIAMKDKFRCDTTDDMGVKKWLFYTVLKRETLTIACSILLSMATTLAPDELRKKKKEILTRHLRPICAVTEKRRASLSLSPF